MHGDETVARSLFTRAVRAATTPFDEAAAWNAWALMEQRKGHIATARKCFVNGLRVNRTHAPLCQAFAVFEAKYGLKRRARELFALASELNQRSPSAVRTWIAWANFEAGEEQHAKARLLFRNALQCAEESCSVSLSNTCTTATTTDHNCTGNEIANAILSFARFEERRKQLRAARDLYRDGLARLSSLGSMQAKTNGKYAHPQCAKLLHAWGTLESHAGNYPRARDLFLSTLSCPGVSGASAAPTYQAWALCEKRAGNISEARRLFGRGADADPGHAYIWQAWGVMEHRLRNHDDARSHFRKGVEADPRSAPTWNAWARLESDCGNHDEAAAKYERATKADPSHTQSWQAWAVMEGKLGHVDHARQLFKEAVAAEPACAPAWNAWARMEEKCGNIEVARQLFQKGVDADPSHAAVWQAWSQMEARLGNWTRGGPACSLAQGEPRSS